MCFSFFTKVFFIYLLKIEKKNPETKNPRTSRLVSVQDENDDVQLY